MNPTRCIKAAALITVLAMALLMFSSCSGKPENNESENISKNVSTSSPITKEQPASEAAPEEFSFGDKFEFAGFDILIGDTIEWTTLDNQYSDHNGEDVIKLPINAKNTSADTQKFSFLWCKIFGANGLKQDMIQSYFKDDLRSIGDMRPEAEAQAYLYFLYDGDGDYYISLEQKSETCEIKIPVAKP